ncbi:MAG: hypothetical protein AAF658_04990, partial [Myxococcota bacterium]
MKYSLWIFALCSGLSFVACSSSESGGDCSDDSDCTAGFFCEETQCRCRTDDVCGDGQVCNTFGICQLAPQCIGNSDCAEGEICSAGERRGGICIAATSCQFNVNCPFGQFCDPQSRTCTAGCRTVGDCALGDICEGGQCVAGQVGGQCTKCPVERGVADGSYCDTGDRCNPAFQTCEPHPDKAGVCQLCNTSSQNRIECPPGLICLVDDTQSGAGAGYCATDCREVSECPGGFNECEGLRLVLDSCSTNSDCTNGGRCVVAAETSQGFCECVGEVDCNGLYDNNAPTNTGSLCEGGRCVGNTDRVCTSGLDCACFEGECLFTGLPCSS